MLGASASHAQDVLNPDSIGHWHFNASGGYSGTLMLDGIGGCFYSIRTSVAQSQANCVVRIDEESDGLIIFGTAASSSVTTPIYGVQNEQQALVPQSAPPIFGFHITSVTSKRMSGKLIAPDSHKNVTMHK
jgi:hypothetical protein